MPEVENPTGAEICPFFARTAGCRFFERCKKYESTKLFFISCILDVFMFEIVLFHSRIPVFQSTFEANDEYNYCHSKFFLTFCFGASLSG